MKISHNLTNHAKKTEGRNLDSFIYDLVCGREGVCNNETSAIKTKNRHSISKRGELRLWLTKMSPKIKKKILSGRPISLYISLKKTL